MSRCRKPIDFEETILCARAPDHEGKCCPHEETIGHGRNKAGRLRRKCTNCGETILAAELIGQEYLKEEELCIEVGLMAHSSIGDYEIIEHDDAADEIRVREGVPPDAIRAISSATFEKKYDARTGRVVHRIIRIALWNKNEAVLRAGKRFNAFPDRLEITAAVAAGMLAELAGVSKDELPEAEELQVEKENRP